MSYWVYFIEKEGRNCRPRLCAAYNSCHSLEEAKRKILEQRKMYDVYSAWIKDGDEKNILFYECYVDGMGYIDKPCSYRVKYEDYKYETSYEDCYDYETEEEANEAIRSEIEVIKENLGYDDFENRYDLEDYGNMVEVTPVASTTIVCRWTRMWR